VSAAPALHLALAQLHPSNLSRFRTRQRRHELDLAWVLVRRDAVLQHDDRLRHRAAQRIGRRDKRRLEDRGVLEGLGRRLRAGVDGEVTDRSDCDQQQSRRGTRRESTYRLCAAMNTHADAGLHRAPPGLESHHRNPPSSLTRPGVDTRVSEPSIVRAPRLHLVHHLIAHDGFRRQEPQQSKLRESAEEETGILVDGFEPVSRDLVMDVPFVREGDPDVDIREKR
jgi:hypothetical protein